jgi:hypothetical protein
MADAIERLTAREAEHIAHLDSMIEDQAARFGWDAEQQDAERVVLDRTAAIAVNFRDFQTLLEAARQPPSQVPAEDVERVARAIRSELPDHLNVTIEAVTRAALTVLQVTECEMCDDPPFCPAEHCAFRTVLRVTEGDKLREAAQYALDVLSTTNRFDAEQCQAATESLRAALHPKQEGEG